ncbi:hypothetical protein OEZ86_007919 [Tetradesmus obliquus]|nr:hypothetical protein OEZ86_007919 [Tetradesmus obliquus]
MECAVESDRRSSTTFVEYTKKQQTSIAESMGLCASTPVVEGDELRHLSEATRRRIGRSAVIAAFVAAGVFVVLADPTGVSAVMAGLLLTILRLAAALFPDYFKDMEDCVYLGFQSLVKVLQDLPQYMKQLKQKLKEAWASAWSTFCAGVRNLWDRFKGGTTLQDAIHLDLAHCTTSKGAVATPGGS